MFGHNGPIHAHGSVAGHLVNARVDSRLAEYSIERSMPGGRQSEPAHDEQLAAIGDQLGPGIPDHDTLRSITNGYSRDVATIALVERLVSDPGNQRLATEYYRHLGLVTADDASIGRPSRLKSEGVILVVPGWYWRDRSYDASLDVPRQYLERHGYRTELLVTDDKGTVERNAELLACRLRDLRQAGKAVVLVSVSKGGAETALALGRLLSWEESRHVWAWVNVNGGVRGTPLADELLGWRRGLVTRLSLWLAYGDSGAGLASMRSGERQRVFESLRLPPHVVIVNFSAVPLSGQVVPRAGRYHELLDDHGPHDGTLLIRDELIDGAPTLTELGFDHFLFDPMIGAKSLALTRVVEDLLENAR